MSDVKYNYYRYYHKYVMRLLTVFLWIVIPISVTLLAHWAIVYLGTLLIPLALLFILSAPAITYIITGDGEHSFIVIVLAFVFVMVSLIAGTVVYEAMREVFILLEWSLVNSRLFMKG